MKQYLDLMKNILDNGEERDDRTGTGTIGIFGYQMRFDLNKGFPLLTTKKLHLKSIIHELLWFISGSTNISYLHKNGVTIWDEWASETTENVGRMYGYQWRNFGGHVDQLKDVILELKNDPYGRRHIVTAWNPEDVMFGKCCLPPCHMLFQFYVDKNNRLSCQLYQRSADVFLGVPFNIASYSLLTMMVAQCCGYGYGEFIHVLGDAHIYKNHLEQARLQLRREQKELPKMTINPDKKDINTFVYDDFYLSDYRPHPHIKAEVSV